MKEKTASPTAVFESRFTGNFRPTLSEISASNAKVSAALSPLQPNLECSAFAKNAEASAAPSFFEKQRSKVIVRVTRKCLSDIFSFPEHLAPAEGIDPENPLPMVAVFEVDQQPFVAAPDGRPSLRIAHNF